MILPPPTPTLFPYTTLFRSVPAALHASARRAGGVSGQGRRGHAGAGDRRGDARPLRRPRRTLVHRRRSEEHTSELQSRFDLVCRLLLEKKKNTTILSTLISF